MGGHLQPSGKLPMQLGCDGGTIELVEDFTYLGSRSLRMGRFEKKWQPALARHPGYLGVCKSLSFRSID